MVSLTFGNRTEGLEGFGYQDFASVSAKVGSSQEEEHIEAADSEVCVPAVTRRGQSNRTW